MDPLAEFPPLPDLGELKGRYDPFPSLTDLGYEKKLHTTFYKGGEREGLRMMAQYFTDRAKAATFEKPKTVPTCIKPDTTALSPYLKFGCLSARLFYHELMDIYK